ncbi:hypothetical protein BT69DRAFT_982403 [Atractiella rhizophila]|nr:hypothetical protein BT69DRAFT_982403 [Atractiella rhizophila]
MVAMGIVRDCLDATILLTMCQHCMAEVSTVSRYGVLKSWNEGDAGAVILSINCFSFSHRIDVTPPWKKPTCHLLYCPILSLNIYLLFSYFSLFPRKNEV